MNEEQLEGLDRFCLVTVRYGLFLVFLLPFFVFRGYLYPWVTGKIWGIELLVTVLFPLYVFLAFRRKEFRPTANAFLIAVLVFFAIATLSMLLGDNIDRSLWSKPDRQTGMFFQYHLLAFFLMAGVLWRGQARKVMIAAAGTSVILSIYAVCQAYLGMGGETSGRGHATLGNPSYLGQYLAANVFLVGWLIYHDRHKTLRWCWVLAVVAIGLGIMATRSRGAIVAVFCAMLFAGIILAWKGQGPAKKWGRRALAGLGILIALFFALDRFAPTHAWLYNQRLAPQYFHESTGSRIVLLENAVRGFVQRPVLGWGPENFESAFYFNYDPVTLKFSQYETRQDRPHNIVLDLLNNLGLLGFLAFAGVYLTGWKRLAGEDTESGGERLFLMLATVALLVATLFIFDTPVSYLLQYVLLALIVATTTHAQEPGRDHLTRWAPIAALFVGLIAAWAFFSVFVPTVKDSRMTARLIMSLQNSAYDAETFDAEVTKLIESPSPYAERNLRAIASNLALEPGNYLTGPFLPILERLGDYHTERSARNIDDYVHALVTSVVLMSQSNRTPERQEALEVAVSRMHALSPNRQEVYWIDAQMRIEKGEYDLAEQSYLRAIELEPSIGDAHVRYALFLILMRHVEDAFTYLDANRSLVDLRSVGPSSSQISRTLASLFDQQDFDTMDKVYEASIAHDLETVEWSFAGIIASAARGDLPKARERAEDTSAKFPDYADKIKEIIAIAERGGFKPRPSTP